LPEFSGSVNQMRGKIQPSSKLAIYEQKCKLSKQTNRQISLALFKIGYRLQTYYTIDGLYLCYAAARCQREREVIRAMKLLKQNQSTEMRLLCLTGSGDNCNAYNVYKNPLNYLFPFSLDIKPPIMLIFLALLAAEQCVAVKLELSELTRSVEHHKVAKFRCLLLHRLKRPAQRNMYYFAASRSFLAPV
jgi:hypothetical protein